MGMAGPTQLDIDTLAIERVLGLLPQGIKVTPSPKSGTRLVSTILQHPMSGSYAFHSELNERSIPIYLVVNGSDENVYPYGRYKVFVDEPEVDKYYSIARNNNWRTTPIMYLLSSIHYGGIRTFDPNSILTATEKNFLNNALSEFSGEFGDKISERAFMCSALIRHGRKIDTRKTHVNNEEDRVTERYETLAKQGIRPLGLENIYGMASRVVSSLID